MVLDSEQMHLFYVGNRFGSSCWKSMKKGTSLNTTNGLVYVLPVSDRPSKSLIALWTVESRPAKLSYS